MRIKSRAYADLLRFFDNTSGDIGEDILLHVQTGARAATLPMIEENGAGGIGDGRVQVAIAEHDVWGLTAEFQGDFFEVARSSLHDELANLGRAGEGYLVHLGMRC